MKKYSNVHLTVKEELYDLVYGVLFDLPVIGIEEKIDELILSFHANDWNDDISKNLIYELQNIDTNIKINKIEEIEDYDWSKEFIKNTKTVKVNDKIGITPSWKVNELDTEIKIIIDPKMSFGTGEHSTTNMMCKLLDKYIKEGDIVIDAGCGTGILSILASKLNARKIYAFDNDEWSFNNSLENFELNNVHNIDLQMAKIEDYHFPESNLILANLFINLIKYSFPKFRESLLKKDGYLIVSGILFYDKDELLNSAEINGFQKIEEMIEDEWVAIVFKLNHQK